MNEDGGLRVDAPVVCGYCGETKYYDRWQDGYVFNFPSEVRRFACGAKYFGNGVDGPGHWDGGTITDCRYYKLGQTAEKKKHVCKCCNQMLPEDKWNQSCDAGGGRISKCLVCGEKMVYDAGSIIHNSEGQQWVERREVCLKGCQQPGVVEQLQARVSALSAEVAAAQQDAAHWQAVKRSLDKRGQFCMVYYKQSSGKSFYGVLYDPHNMMDYGEGYEDLDVCLDAAGLLPKKGEK